VVLEISNKCEQNVSNTLLRKEFIVRSYQIYKEKKLLRQ